MQIKGLQALTEFPHSPIGLQRVLINACQFGDVKKVKRIIEYVNWLLASLQIAAQTQQSCVGSQTLRPGKFRRVLM